MSDTHNSHHSGQDHVAPETVPFERGVMVTTLNGACLLVLVLVLVLVRGSYLSLLVRPVSGLTSPPSCRLQAPPRPVRRDQLV